MSSLPSEWSTLCVGSCPPPDAQPLGRSIYRFVKDPPKPSDWQTHAELGNSPGADPCERCGYSCSMDLEAAKEARAAIPRRRTSRIARGTLPAQAAVYKQTGASRDHYTVWLRQSFHAAWVSFFQVLDA